jgi:hypothetical protein
LIDFSIPLEELEGFYTPKKPSKKGIARGEGKSVRKSTSSGSSSSSRGYKGKTTSKETAVAKPKDRKPTKRWY